MQLIDSSGQLLGEILQRGTTPLSLSFSVSLGCEVCSIRAAPTSCQSDQHAFHHRISHRPFESVSHCCHSPTGTVILDTKEQKRRKGRTEIQSLLWVLKQNKSMKGNCKQINDVPLPVRSTPPLVPFYKNFSISGSPFFSQKRIQSGLTFGLYKWRSSSSFLWHIGEDYTAGFPMFFMLFHNNIWPKSANILMWHSRR